MKVFTTALLSWFQSDKVLYKIMELEGLNGAGIRGQGTGGITLKKNQKAKWKPIIVEVTGVVGERGREGESLNGVIP